MKVSVVGVGKVGKAIAFALVTKGMVSDLVLVGRQKMSALGDALDLRHASCFSHPAMIRTGDIADTEGSDVVVLTAAAGHDMNSRRNTAKINADLFRTLVPPLAKASPDAVFVVVTNPIDALVYLTQELSGLPHGRVTGTGTLLDTLRFRALLADRVDVHPHDLRAYVLGEHGDSQVAAISAASVGGAPIDLPLEEIHAIAAQAKQSGMKVAREKGYTDYAVALAAIMIIEAVITNSRPVLPVTTRVQNYAGVSDVCLSVPAIVGRDGVIRTLPIRLNEEETAAFQESARIIKEMQDICLKV